MHEKPFFILWNPHYPRPPTVRFSTREAAQKSADLMASTLSGVFYICRAESYSSSKPGPAVRTPLTARPPKTGDFGEWLRNNFAKPQKKALSALNGNLKKPYKKARKVVKGPKRKTTKRGANP